MLAEAPPDDLGQWQEAFEASVLVSDYGMYYESPTLDIERIEVPPGQYRLRITGRGFVARGWPGSTKPGDEWRIQLWPPRPESRRTGFKPGTANASLVSCLMESEVASPQDC
jgi:hypothetical protein